MRIFSMPPVLLWQSTCRLVPVVSLFGMIEASSWNDRKPTPISSTLSLRKPVPFYHVLVLRQRWFGLIMYIGVAGGADFRISV